MLVEERLHSVAVITLIVNDAELSGRGKRESSSAAENAGNTVNLSGLG